MLRAYPRISRPKRAGRYQAVAGSEASSLFKKFKKHGSWGEGGCKTVSPVLVTNEDDLAGVTVEGGKMIVGV